MNIILKGHKKDLGDQFIIRRVLPAMEKRSVGPFVFFDHFGPVSLTKGDEMVVRSHPHIGLATITFLYDGLIHHRDSLGISQLIRPFETNWMTAGKGIAHSERSEKNPESDLLEGIQTWIALPKEKEDIDPSFQHISKIDIPIHKEQGITLSLLGGSFMHLTSPANVHSPLIYADIQVEENASEVSWPLEANQEAGIYVSKGKIQINGEIIDEGKMFVFPLGSQINFKPLEKSRLMLLGGEPLPEKRILWWNFVSTSQEKIDSAKDLWAKDLFPKVKGETDRIPLPEK